MQGILLVLVLLLAANCARREPPQAAVSPKDDPRYQEIRQLVEAKSDCFQKQAMAKRLNAFDIETAALAVKGACTAESQRFSAYSIRHTIESVPVATERMRRGDADDLQHIKQMLALIRTSKEPAGNRR